MSQTGKDLRTRLPAKDAMRRATEIDINEAEASIYYRLARDFMMDHPPESFTVVRYCLLKLILEGKLVYEASTKRTYDPSFAPENTREALKLARAQNS